MKAGFRYDVVVIGAGTAGLVAGIRLAQSGASVAVLAKGVGSTHLAPATLDIAGYTPKPVAVPLKGVAALTANDAGHPYELIGTDTLRESVEWFADTVAAGPLAPYAYAGSLKRNMLLPTAVGALRPSALVPTTMVAGDASATSVSETGRKSSRSATFSTCIVGTPSLRDFHPSLCAANLTAAGFPARPVMLELELERADMSTLGIARHLDDARWRAGFCGRLARLLRSDEQTVGLPAMLGIADPDGVMTDIEKRLGRRVFEIPSLPPSVPGMRLYETLRAALLGAGGRLMLGAEVIAHERSGDRIRSVSTRAAGHDVSYAADWFVLAAGASRQAPPHLTPTGARMSTCLTCRCAVAPQRASPVSSPSTLQSSRSSGSASRSAKVCAPRVSTTCWSPAPPSRARFRGERAAARALP